RPVGCAGPGAARARRSGRGDGTRRRTGVARDRPVVGDGPEVQGESEHGMRIGVPKEARPGETLVAASPTSVTRLAKLGYDVVVETGAGEASSFPDTAYREAGATVADADEVWTAQVVTTVG